MRSWQNNRLVWIIPTRRHHRYEAPMDGWRVGLLVAAAVFVLFLLAKMRPRLDDDETSDANPSDPPPEPRRLRRTERRLWRRIRRLPLRAQRRMRDRLDRALEDGPEADAEATDSPDEDAERSSRP